jgi:NAD(P)-dependent dehydrogenase (short-subunit alcohol dehydrogenase family)
MTTSNDENASAHVLGGKVAIVTGAGTGLGAATAQVLAAAGATVVLCGRRRDKLEATHAAIAAHGGKSLAIACDMSDPADVRNLVAETVRQCGGVDILINNAGRHTQFLPTTEVSLDDFDDYLFVNLRGPFVAMQSAIPHMLARGGGAIVNIASMAGLVGLKYAAPYCAVKGGLVQMTKAVAVEYADRHITVNCICPGGMEPTENTHQMTPAELARINEAIQGGAPTGRSANVFDVAQMILLIVGPASRNLTGAIIPYDGGYTAR